MKEIIRRVKSPTPKFFKKVIKIGLTVGAVGLAIIGAPAAVPGLVLPIIIGKVAGYMVAVGGVSATIAKTAVDDKAVPK